MFSQPIGSELLKIVAGLLLFIVASAPGASWAAAPPGCLVSSEQFTANGGLDRSRAAVRAGRLRVLAIGSSSIEGIGASRPEFGFVPLLEAGLERRLPGVEATVVNRGIGGESTLETVNRLQRELAAGPFDLVLWQLGTNDVLRSRPMKDIMADFRRGGSILDRAGVEVLLVDPQRVPDTSGNVFRPKIADLADVARIIRLEADRMNYALSSRHDAMAAWGGLEGGGVGADNLHFNDGGYACWAEITAHGLSEALK